jgi:hypothetical protein
MIDNISITIDSEYGYHVYIYYTDLRVGKYNEKCIYEWTSCENIENIFMQVLEKISKIREE